MIIEKKNKDIITISFSASVGEEGLKRIKSFIQILEKSSMPSTKRTAIEIKPKKPISKKAIQKLADEVNVSAWKKFKRIKGL